MRQIMSKNHERETNNALYKVPEDTEPVKS